MAAADTTSVARAEPLVSYADLALLIGLTLASCVLLDAGVISSNDGANYALVRALGDGGVQIDAYREYTYDIDYALRDDHYYSPRAPGTAFLVLPFYVAAHALTNDDATLQFVSGLCPALFLSALACLTYLVARRLGFSRAAGVLTALALCLGTPLRSYGSGLWSHVLAAFFSLALVALAHAAMTREDATTRAVRYATGLGLLSALIVSVDYSGALYATVALVIVVIDRAMRAGVREAALRWALPIIGGGLVGMAPTLVYHRIAFGSPFSTGYDYAVGEYVVVHHLSGMYGGHFLEGFFGLLVHPRAGLFLWSPILLAGVVACRSYAARLPSRALLALFTLPALAMFLLTSRYTWWDGGGVHDVRFITQSLPLIALPVAAAADASLSGAGPRRPLAALGFSVLFALSMLLQAIKHHAYWARDGSVWLPRLRDAGDAIGSVAGSFAAWCWPHPVAAAVIAGSGMALAAGLSMRERARA